MMIGWKALRPGPGIPKGYGGGDGCPPRHWDRPRGETGAALVKGPVERPRRRTVPSPYRTADLGRARCLPNHGAAVEEGNATRQALGSPSSGSEARRACVGSADSSSVHANRHPGVEPWQGRDTERVGAASPSAGADHRGKHNYPRRPARVVRGGFAAARRLGRDGPGTEWRSGETAASRRRGHRGHHDPSV